MIWPTTLPIISVVVQCGTEWELNVALFIAKDLCHS